MFANDLFLLSISVSELQQMMLICKNELDLLDMTVNTNKSMCMRIGERFNVTISNLLNVDRSMFYSLGKGNTLFRNLHSCSEEV